MVAIGPDLNAHVPDEEGGHATVDPQQVTDSEGERWMVVGQMS